jgi:hypothetical protein
LYEIMLASLVFPAAAAIPKTPFNTINMKLLIRYKAIITCDLELSLTIIRLEES